MNTDYIPQTNPKASYLAYKNEINEAVNTVLESGWYILGKQVEAFEREFASFVGIGYGVSVASGTDAIEIALRALGIGSGDLVFTVSHTAVATVAAIERCGASPILVDIEPSTFTMAPNHLEHTIKTAKGRPKAVIPVHLYGHPADMTAIMDIAHTNNLYVIEDCAQSHGAQLNSQKTGSFGHMAAFSFYPTKNLGAVGDGGMVVTDNKELCQKLMALRQYGWEKRYISSMHGINSRLDEIQAAILRVKLKYLANDNKRRRQIAETYTRSLESAKIASPQSAGNISHVYHQYVIKTENRDNLLSHLANQSISTAIHYPQPLHLQPAYKNEIHVGPNGLPVTEKICDQILSLPMYPQMTEAQIDRVISAILKWERNQ